MNGAQVTALVASDTTLRIVATARTHDCTGVEMEVLTGASVAALCLYDMLKRYDPAIVIGPIRLLEKSGGKSGVWHAQAKTRSGCAPAPWPSAVARPRRR